MKRSLQWRLSLMLGGTVLATGLLATAVTFFIAYSEAREFQDHTLRQLAVLIDRNVSPLSQQDKVLGPAHAEENLSDPEERIQVYHIPLSVPDKLFATSLVQGIQNLDTLDGRLRCYVMKDKGGNLLAVTQPTEIRDELALESALHVFTPMMLLLPLMTWLITLIVRRELKPVKKLAHYLDKQPANQPRSLPDWGVPAEIAPFVQALNRHIDRVNTLLAQQRRFIADAAHELRSPLTALSLQIQNVESAGSPEAMTRRLQPLKSGIERAIKLTEQLLNLARVQSGDAEYGKINVSILMRRLIEEYLPMAETKHIDLGLDEETELNVFASEKNIHLIMKNGLENGLKYTPVGGMVTIRLYSRNNKAYCEVVDNGPGIDESVREQLFEPFFRPPGGEAEGNGLGLAIAREAAARQGGEIELIANKDKPGLTFRYSQTLNRNPPS